jgi:dTMP kinase
LIEPQLSAGKFVICDRYLDSSLAYQGYGQGLNLEWIKTTSKDLPVPQLTVLLDLPAHIGLTRQQQQQKFEKLGIEFLEKARQGYLEIARQEPKRFLVLDALDSTNQLLESITQEIKHRYFKTI